MDSIIQQFAIKGEAGEIKPLKIGHINDSFIVENKDANGDSYFLQKINHHIFKDVEGLQRNIQLVTDHLREKLQQASETDIDRKVLRLIPTKDNKLFYKDEAGDYWRMYINIRGTKSYDIVNEELSQKAGKAFGNFQLLLSDISHDELIETIPDFHNMEFRLRQFREAVDNNAAGRVELCRNLIEEIELRAEEMCLPQRLFREGKLVKRINHCDTKVNNMLFDENDEPICIVDLDTVMPGFVLSDFGDFMRSAANNGKEDDTELANVWFRMDIFKAYTIGYLSLAKGFLTPLETEMLPFGAKLITYMQLVRFLGDYINGDTYYKTEYPEHNLQRSKSQFTLLQDIERKYEEMQHFIAELSK